MKAGLGILILAMACSPPADSQLQQELAESRKTNAELQKQLDEAQAKLIVAEKMLAKGGGGTMQAAMTAAPETPFQHETVQYQAQSVAQVQSAQQPTRATQRDGEPGMEEKSASELRAKQDKAQALESAFGGDPMIKAHCVGEWATNEDMQLSCAKTQSAGKAKLVELESKSAPSEMGIGNWTSAKNHCLQEWPDNYDMRAGCLANFYYANGGK